MSVTYFTASGLQHGSMWTGEGCNFARKVEKCLELKAGEEARADEIKAQRIADLKGQLAALTGEPA